MTDESPLPAKRSRKRTSAGDAAQVALAAPPVESPAAPPVGQPVVEQEPAPTPAPIAQVASLRLERGGIAEASADTVEVRMGGIGALDADEVFVQWGGIGAARAKRVEVEFGSLGAAMAGELRVTQGFAGTVVAREATIEQGIVRTLFAQRVEVKRPSAVLVMIAQHVSGEIRPLLDWRGALAFGAAFSLVSGLVRAGRTRRNETVRRSR